MDRYPEEDELEKIKSWDYLDPQGCFEFIASIWEHQNYCDHEGTKWYLSTGGWSGNEEIIQALKSNYILWVMTWEESRRGGHYIFDLGRCKDAS